MKWKKILANFEFLKIFAFKMFFNLERNRHFYHLFSFGNNSSGQVASVKCNPVTQSFWSKGEIS